jgi:hypothetical protein
VIDGENMCHPDNTIRALSLVDLFSVMHQKCKATMSHSHMTQVSDYLSVHISLLNYIYKWNLEMAYSSGRCQPKVKGTQLKKFLCYYKQNIITQTKESARTNLLPHTSQYAWRLELNSTKGGQSLNLFTISHHKSQCGHAGGNNQNPTSPVPSQSQNMGKSSSQMSNPSV